MAEIDRPELDPLPLPDPPGLLGGWGRKIEDTLLRAWLKGFNTVMSPFWEYRDKATKFLFQSIEDEIKPVITPLLDTIEANENLPTWVREMTKHLRFSEPITFAVIASALIMAAIVGLVMGIVGPIMRVMSQETDSYVHSARMTPQEAFVALKRGAISESDYHNQTSDGGWSEQMEGVWKTILSPLVGVGDISQLFLRGEINEDGFDRQLATRGYKSEEISKIKSLLHIIPPLTDIIQMAVREAFTPDVVQRFQLHAELPGEMVSWAKKQGLSEEWSRAYWASHWNLPSLRMGYEMLHRGAISEGEMAMLIKAQDISPFWRDKLIEISYSPYTRVDVRRMHGVGVLNVAGVKRAYLDLGYNEERANNLTAFTVALSNATERDLTKSEIMYGYEHAFFNPQETDDLLYSLGYDQAEADYYKSKVDFKLAQASSKQVVKSIELQYVANQIGQNEVYAQLGALNLPAAQMNRYILAWDLKKQAKTKTLTAEKLVLFRKQDVITDGDFRSEMSGLGYSERYIKWYLDSMARGEAS